MVCAMGSAQNLILVEQLTLLYKEIYHMEVLQLTYQLHIAGISSIMASINNGPTVLEIGVDVAFTMFNDDRIDFLKIMEEFDVKLRRATLEWVNIKDNQRLLFA